MTDIDKIIDDMPKYFAIMLIVFVGAASIRSAVDWNVKDDFMDECLQYQKQYECTAMWRQE